MATIQGHKIKKACGLVGNAYFNNFGVEYYLLEDGEIMMQGMKYGRKIPKFNAKISKEFFEERFNADDSNNIDNIIGAIQFLDPEYGEG